MFVSGEIWCKIFGDMVLVIVLVLIFVKLMLMMSLSDMMQLQYVGGVEDFVIGEMVDYMLIVFFLEGVMNNVVVVDMFFVGVVGIFEVIGVLIMLIGGQILIFFVGILVFSDVFGSDGFDDIVIFDFGIVINMFDNVVDVDDCIILLIMV